MDEWIAGVINPAWEKASGGATPDYVNLLAKLALDAICGDDQAKAMARLGSRFRGDSRALLLRIGRDDRLGRTALDDR